MNSRKPVFFIALYCFVFPLQAQDLSCIKQLGPRFTSEYSMGPVGSVTLPNGNAILVGISEVFLFGLVYSFLGDDGSSNALANSYTTSDTTLESDENSYTGFGLNRVVISGTLSSLQNIYLVYARIQDRKKLAPITFLTYGAYAEGSEIPGLFDRKLEPSEKDLGLDYFNKFSRQLETDLGYNRSRVAQLLVYADQLGLLCDPNSEWTGQTIEQIESNLSHKVDNLQRNIVNKMNERAMLLILGASFSPFENNLTQQFAKKLFDSFADQFERDHQYDQQSIRVLMINLVPSFASDGVKYEWLSDDRGLNTKDSVDQNLYKVLSLKLLEMDLDGTE